MIRTIFLFVILFLAGCTAVVPRECAVQLLEPADFHAGFQAGAWTFTAQPAGAWVIVAAHTATWAGGDLWARARLVDGEAWSSIRLWGAGAWRVVFDACALSPVGDSAASWR